MSLIVRAAAFVLLAMGLAVPSSAQAHETCASAEDVPVVVEFAGLAGTDRVACAQHSAGLTAIKALSNADIAYEVTTAASPMLCRVEGQPTRAQEKCGATLSGDGYWAFLVAREGQPWGYAAVGLADYVLQPGGFVALRYHRLADGEQVPVDHAANAQTRADAEVAEAHEADHSDHDSGADQRPTVSEIALPVAVVAALLVAVTAFVVARRRHD